MEYDVPYTSSNLMERLGLKAREGFRRNYLRPAIEMDLIQMTIPDKPNSRNQRYVKKITKCKRHKEHYIGEKYTKKHRKNK